MAEVVRNIRSSFDLWCGVSSELSSVSCGISKPQQRHSLQLEPQMHFSGSQLCDSADQLLTSDTTELLMLLQQQQASTDAEAETPSADELGIDAQIKRLLELKQFLRRTKATTGQQQQQQVILEDVALADAANALDAATAASASGLFCSSGLVTPLQSESLLNNGSPTEMSGWGNLAAVRAAAQPARRSVDLGGLAQQLAALEMSNNAAAAALADSQAFAAATMRPSVSFTADGTRMSMDLNENYIAAAAMAAAANAQAEAARRDSLCLNTPQMSGLLDTMLLDQLNQGAPDMIGAGATLAMQSALYAPATPAPLEAQLQAPVSLAGMSARHSLDCSMLSVNGMAALGAQMALASPSPRPAGHASGLLSPAVNRRASFNLPQAGQQQQQFQAPPQAMQSAETAGWGFSSRRAGTSGRTSCDVRRVSSDLMRSHTPDLRQPPRKSVSLITPASSAASSCSSNSSGRNSPGSRQHSRASLDMSAKPPVCPAAAAAATTTITSAAIVPAAANAVNRKGTGVFIPSCMIKA